MATSDLVDAVEKEISCPICYEDFEEPKCLPNCAHNVCQHCIEKIAKKRNNTIECPVCRAESVIPDGGVAYFPKNHLVVRLVEKTARKEKRSVEQALEKCRIKIESAKANLNEIGDHLTAAKSEAEKNKQEINAVTEDVVSMVRDCGRKMICEIDLRCSQNLNEEKFATHKLNTTKLCKNASSYLGSVRDALQNGRTSDLKRSSDYMVEKLNNFSKSLDARMFWAKCEFKQPFEVSFAKTDSLKKFSKDECLLGKIKIEAPTPVTSRLIVYSRSGSMMQIIDSSSCGTAKITPVSVAVCRFTGHLAALDRMNYVHLFKENGEAMRTICITHGDPWDIALLKDEIIVLDRESNRLLHFNTYGVLNGKRKPITAPPRKNVKFSSLSVDLRYHFIISSCPCSDETDTLPCILIYNPSGEFVSLVGEGLLSSPEKAVSLNDKYFVADSGEQCVMVFDKKGLLLQKFGSSLTQLVLPSSIAVNYSEQHLLVSDSGNSTIQIYNQDGIKQYYFQTEHAPIGVAFTKDCENVLICFSS